MTQYKEKYGGGTRKVIVDFGRGTMNGPWVYANVPVAKVKEELENLKSKSHPLFPEMKCKSVELEYFNSDPSRETYTQCNLHAYFETPEELQWDSKEPEQSISVRAGVEWVTLSQKLKWETSEGDEIDQNIAIPMRVIYISVRKVQGSLPISIMRDLVGKINSGSVRMVGQSFPAGTLRYDSSESEEYGNKWNITYNFAIKDNGWQKIPDGSTSPISWKTTYPLLYETANLSRLV